MKKFRSLILLILISTSILSYAQEGIFNSLTGKQLDSIQAITVIPDSFDLFDSKILIEVTIESDFKKLVKRKMKDEYQPALLHYQLNDSLVSKRFIRIKPRGEFRKRYCSFPPIKLNFKKSGFMSYGVEELEKMKMVTHCRSSKAYEAYILKEYLIYQLFELLTDKSFKSRLLRVKYMDTGRNDKITDSYAFVIEGAKKLAQRHNSILIKRENLSQPYMDQQHMDLVAMFEFMIGNTDWSIPGPHNMKLLKVLELEQPNPYPVPYDFDYCGLVDTEYAVPTEGLGIKDVKIRLYQGYCRALEEYQPVIDKFLAKEQAMYDTINNFEYLGKRDKREMTYYMEEFFRLIKRPKAFKNIAENTCKTE
ncbi:MAG: hypothetical protein AAF502_15935 [Bacteroidota bacterium]